MRICIPVPCFFRNMDFCAAIKRIHELGFDAAETYNWKDLDQYADRHACEENGVELLSMSTTNFNLTDPLSRDAWLAGLKESCEAAKRMGVKHLITQVGPDTGARRDFSAQPPQTMCDILKENGKTVYGVGKIEDIFDHHGITKSNHAAGNPACMQATFEAMDEDFDGLLFVNLVDFDMVYGHRRDVKGYAAALETFDAQLPEIQAKMGEDDLLMITADHGCDPCHSGTDHTREHTPLLVWSRKMQGGVNLGVRATYADISATVLDYFGLANPLRGTSFLEELK